MCHKPAVGSNTCAPERIISATSNVNAARVNLPLTAVASPCKMTSADASVVLFDAPAEVWGVSDKCQARQKNESMRTADDDCTGVVISTCRDVVVPVQQMHRPRGNERVGDRSVGNGDSICERKRLCSELRGLRRPVWGQFRSVT